MPFSISRGARRRAGTGPLYNVMTGNGSRADDAAGSSPHEYAVECEHPSQRFRPIFSTRDYITGEPFVVGYCNDCKLHVTSPIPGEDELPQFYPSSYYGS